MRRYVEWVIRHRLLVIAITVAIAGVLAVQSSSSVRSLRKSYRRGYAA